MKNAKRVRVLPCFTSVAVLAATLLISSSIASQAQTLITPDLKAPPGSYNTSKTGMVIRAHQISVVRTPGDQNSIVNVQNELNGGYGPSLSLATNGPLTGGLWAVTNINYALDPNFPVDGDPDWQIFTILAEAFPGIVTDTNLTGGVSTFAYEIITYLNLPAGINYLGVGSGDSFRLTIGAGDNPFDYFATQPANGSASGSRAYNTNIMAINVQSAGVYPVRIIYGQGGGTAGLQFYSYADFFGSPANLPINDPWGYGYQLTSYQPATLPVTPSKAYVSLLSPYPGQLDAFPKPTITAKITDAATTVNTNSILMAFDGAPVVPTITQTGGVTYVSYVVPNLLPPLSTYPVSLSFADSSANVSSNTWSFRTDSFLVIPASYSYPAGSGNTAAKGFNGKVHVAQASAGFTAVIASTDARLRDSYNAFSNLAQTVSFPGPTANTVNNDFTYTRNEPINYSMDGTASAVNETQGVFTSGNGYPDAIYPGLPGATDNTRATWTSAANMAWASWAWVELPQGLVQINIGHFDAGQVAIHANDPQDIFRETAVIFDSNGGNRTDSRLVYIEQAGIYGFRCAQAAFGTGASLWFEFYVSDPFDANNRTLIGVPTNPTYQAYTQLTVPTRPYIDAVRPDVSSSGAALDTTIQVDVVNLGAETPVMKVNGQAVSYTKSVAGSKTTLSYTPAQPFAKAAAVTVSLTYGTTTSTWSFFTTSGLKALVVGNENVAIRERLGSVFRLDVTQIADSNPSDPRLLDTNFLAGFALLWNSEAVNSGNVQGFVQAARQMPIPAINVESANAATGTKHWYLGSAANNFGGGNVHFVVVTNTDFGLPRGTNRITKIGAANGTWHAADLGQTGGYTSVGYGPGNESAAAVAMFEKGTVQPFNGPDGATPFVMPARRAQMAMAGPGMISVWNDNAWKIFDKVVEWILPPKPPVLSIVPATSGNVTISWTANGTLQESDNVASGYTDSLNQANPQTRPAVGTKFFRTRQ